METKSATILLILSIVIIIIGDVAGGVVAKTLIPIGVIIVLISIAIIFLNWLNKDREKRKKKILFAASALVGIMFVFSYLGVSGNAPSTTSSSTTTMGQVSSFFASGTANATITGYASTAILTLNTNATEVSNAVASYLSSMRNNGTIQNYVSDGQTYDLILGNVSAYALQQMLYSQLNSTNAITLSSTANARLVGRADMFVGSQELFVPINGTYQLNFTPLIPANSLIKLGVQALLTQNGLVYNNQVTVSYKR